MIGSHGPTPFSWLRDGPPEAFQWRVPAARSHSVLRGPDDCPHPHWQRGPASRIASTGKVISRRADFPE